MFPSVTILMWGKHMITGYPSTATTPDLRVCELERRVAKLEGEFDRRHHKAEMDRMWRWYYGYSALMAVGISVIVYLAGSLD